MDKIKDFESLAADVKKIKNSGQSIVLCHGVFDLLHVGHLRYLRQARQNGDILVVTLTPDRFVDKGPGRPVFNEKLRAEALASLSFVDYVAINLWPTAEETLLRLAPDYYVKGAEFKELEADPTGKIAREAQAAEKVGAKLVFAGDLVFSSSRLINQYLDVYPQELANYLQLLRQRYRLDEIVGLIDRMRDLKVLVVGDSIVDEYCYCTLLGLSSKDPTLALNYLSSEAFPGGALAVARHAAGLSGRVTLLTTFGERGNGLELARQGLPSSVEIMYETVPGAPTVRKRRYLDNYSLQKFLEIYDMAPEPPPAEVRAGLARRLSDMIGDFDVVLAADFGHGAISKTMIEIMGRKAAFLAVNTQANAGNRGYHTIKAYPRADLVSLARHELTLAFQDREAPLGDLMLKLAALLSTSCLLVTCGSAGLRGLAGDSFIQAPAVAARVVDRVGAGDALFAAAALAHKLNCPMEIIGLIGNIAGAHLVENVGNNESLEAAKLKAALTAMLK